MTYHRIDKGSGQETQHDRNEMQLQTEDRGFYKRGTMKEAEQQVVATGTPIRLQTHFAYWEIRP